MVRTRRDLLAAGLSSVAFGAFGGGARAGEMEATAPSSGAQTPPTSRSAGAMELALAVHAPSTPTGLALSRSGRVFVMMPRFTAEVPITVGEVAADGRVTPYPSAQANVPDPKAPQSSLLHVPNGVFDRDDTLWLLDAGLPSGAGAPVPGGAKLVQIDLVGDRIRRVIPTALLIDLCP